MLKKINEDLYDIAWRIKAIDADYEIFYNTVTHRYEIWADNKIQLVLPFLSLDARAVDELRRTRIERLDKLINEMEIYNKNLSASREKNVLDESVYKTKHLLKYLEKGAKHLPRYEEI